MVFTYYETFPHRGRETQQYFDVSSPSSGRDKNRDSHFWLIFEEKYLLYSINWPNCIVCL